MKQLKKISCLVVLVLTYTAVTSQSNDTLFYRHSFQANVAGLGIERWGIAYELRMILSIIKIFYDLSGTPSSCGYLTQPTRTVLQISISGI